MVIMNLLLRAKVQYIDIICISHENRNPTIILEIASSLAPKTRLQTDHSPPPYPKSLLRLEG